MARDPWGWASLGLSSLPPAVLPSPALYLPLARNTCSVWAYGLCACHVMGTEICPPGLKEGTLVGGGVVGGFFCGFFVVVVLIHRFFVEQKAFFLIT